MNQLIEQKFLALFEQQWGKKADRTEMLPASGSARKYWRIYWNGESCIAAWNRNVEENRLFIDFSRHFAEKGLHVPQIYAVSEDRKVYLQEDLGRSEKEIVCRSIRCNFTGNLCPNYCGFS